MNPQFRIWDCVEDPVGHKWLVKHLNPFRVICSRWDYEKCEFEEESFRPEELLLVRHYASPF